MKRTVKAILSLLLAFAVIFTLNISNYRVSATNDGYLDFHNITNRQLPFNYENIGAIGGGSGYNAIVQSGTFTVSARDANNNLKTSAQIVAEIKADINAAASGDTIFIDPNCVIDISESIVINKPLTIASSRGYQNSDGALFRAADNFPGWDYIFNVQSDNVRISGLSLRGNKDRNLAAFGIHMYNYTDSSGNEIPLRNVEVDNCDISYFVLAMDIQETTNTTAALSENAFTIHHNYIHQNNLPNLYSDYGYGVAVNNAYPKIYANIFQNNRHDIAATGHEKNGYEAYCNIVLGDTGTQSNFDMHAIRIYNSDGTYTTSYNAGGFMHIHHNDFRCVNPQANIYPVGKPTTLCLVDNNRFTAGSIFSGSGSSAIMQTCWDRTNSSQGYGNIVAINNIYGGSSYLGWYARETWDKTRTDNFFRIPSTNDLLMSADSAAISGSWINTSQQDLDYYLGDFNADGVTDIFKSENNIWYYLPINTGYTDHWIQLNGSDYKIGTMTLQSGNDVYKYTPSMIFGNFDSNNSTDILVTTGSQWNVSYGGTTPWQSYVSSSATVDQLLFGKFHASGFNDSITDAFYPYNGTWYVSYDGSGWNSVNASSAPYSQLKTGDFNGDGYSDIFCANGSVWQYSSNATGSWASLKSSSINADSIVLDDFNADGKSDVICLNNGNWNLSLSGTSGLSAITTSNYPLASFLYGNFN